MCKWWARPLVWLGLVLAAALIPGTGNAEYRGGTIKIGVLNDQSGVYADIAGTALGLDGAQGSRGFRRLRQGHEGRDHRRRSPEQARHRLEHRTPVVRRRQGRCHRRRADLVGRARDQ